MDGLLEGGRGVQVDGERVDYFGSEALLGEGEGRDSGDTLSGRVYRG